MKNVLGFAITLCLLTSSLYGQAVFPPSVSVIAVPGYTSPNQDVRFTNKGATPLTLTVSLSGTAFSMPENRCANGVKPGTHCDVYVAYAPLGIEQDNGSLVFTYGDNQMLTVPLTGEGVQSIPTSMTMRPDRKDGAEFTVTVTAADGYKIPDSDLVDIECVIYWGEQSVTQYLTNGKAVLQLDGCNTTGENYEWSCDGYFNDPREVYPIDPEFAPSYSGGTVRNPTC